MKPLPPSRALAAKLVFAAFNILKDSSGGSLRSQELFSKLEKTLDLDDWARQAYAKSGYTRWVSILHFFSIDCVKAGYLEKEQGVWKLTDSGRNAIKLGERGLLDEAGKAYRDWKKENQPALVQEQKSSEDADLEMQPPEELLEGTFNRINTDLAGEILQRIKNCSPAFFERLVVELLVSMGYGGTRQDAGRAVGRSGDEGIDGVIHEDRLGLDMIYLQAKRWEGVVGRPEIQKFVGALQGQRAKKGVFITTSDFTKEAVEYVRNIDNKVVLINGSLLASLMIDHNVGVSLAATYGEF